MSKGIFSHPDQKNLYGLFNDSFPPILDGVTLTVENYARWLDAKGMTPCIVTPWNPVSVTYDHEVMRYFSLPIWSRKPYRYGYPKLDPFIWRRLAATDFRLLHSHCPFSSGRLAVYLKKKKGIPLIGTFHSKYRTDLEHSLKVMSWCVPMIMKRILAFFNECDEVWIPQAYVEDTVREYGFKGKLKVVENGNDFADIISGDTLTYKNNAKERLGADPAVLRILFVGQHILEKGVMTILDTLRLINGKVRFHMDFIGTGYAVDEMKRKILEYGLSDKVVLHGIISDRNTLSDYYAASDIFIFPSMYDNAPLVVREAAAMGTPAILLKDSTASEVVTDGSNGFISENDSSCIASLIAKIDGRRDILHSAAEGARQTLVRSWKDVVDEVAERYKKIIHDHNSQS